MNLSHRESAKQPGEQSPALSATAKLNDTLRQTGTGGRVMLTAGIAALPRDDHAGIVAAVQAFDAFDPDNDPHGEHDFGLVRIAGQRVMFKIDYYDLELRGHSPDPADPAMTCRVLTIMLSEEY